MLRKSTAPWKHIKRLNLAFAMVLCSFVAVVAAEQSPECNDATIIYARGSKQESTDSKEFLKLDELVQEFTKTSEENSVEIYELGSEVNTKRYEEVLKDVLPYSPQDVGLWGLIGARFVGGNYDQSVEKGVKELTKVLQLENTHCPKTRIVLVGYSQGAHVIGDMLAKTTPTIRKQIVRVALFGDPKLTLPEGSLSGSPDRIVANESGGSHACLRDPLTCVLNKVIEAFVPDACIGNSFSPWRRGTVRCVHTHGSLGPRNPYVPEDIKNRVGSWCDAKDGICTGNILDANNEAHGKYSVGYIGEAWRNEILPAIGGIKIARPTVVEEVAPDPNESPRPASAGQIEEYLEFTKSRNSGSDVAFLIDTTSSMEDDIEAAKLTASITGRSILANGGRVAVASFGDGEVPYLYDLKTNFTSELAVFQRAINSLKTCNQEENYNRFGNCGNQDEQERLLGGLMRLYDDLVWQPGLAKAVIVLTDARYHNPDSSYNGKVVDENDVIRRSLDNETKNIFPVISASFDVGTFKNLASSTGGEVLVSSGDSASALIGAVDKVVNRLILSFPFEEYLALPGDEISFALSYFGLEDIERYEWDFDGDSITDLTTTEPIATYAFSNEFAGVVAVRAYSGDGNVGSAVVGVQVLEAGISALLPSETISATYESINQEKREFQITWNAEQPDQKRDSLAVVSSEGRTWLIDQSQFSLKVDAVPYFGETFYIMSVNEYGTSTPTVVDIPSELDENVFYLTITGVALIGLGLILSRRRQRTARTISG